MLANRQCKKWTKLRSAAPQNGWFLFWATSAGMLWNKFTKLLIQKHVWLMAKTPNLALFRMYCGYTISSIFYLPSIGCIHSLQAANWATQYTNFRVQIYTLNTAYNNLCMAAVELTMAKKYISSTTHCQYITLTSYNTILPNMSVTTQLYNLTC